MALSVGNVLCRRLVHESKPLERDKIKSLLQLMSEVGKESCELDTDETQHLFEKNLNYLNHIFPNSTYKKNENYIITKSDAKNLNVLSLLKLWFKYFMGSIIYCNIIGSA